MTNFFKSMVLVLIAFLVTPISVADESLIEDKERAEVNSKASAATNNSEKKMTCKKIKVTGSYMKRRVWLSAEGWENLSVKTQQQLDDIMSSSGTVGGGMTP